MEYSFSNRFTETQPLISQPQLKDFVMTRIITGFKIQSLSGDPSRKTAIMIAPPIYDTQYWVKWGQPYGLLRIVALLEISIQTIRTF